MGRASDALLQWLRQMLEKRSMNVAGAAERTGIARTRLRKVLSGAVPMTVDELIVLSQALEIEASELGLAGLQELEEGDENASIGVATDETEDDSDQTPSVDPWGNQPRQLFEVAFAFGCDFFFFAATAELGTSGLPRQVLKQYEGKKVPIRLEAAYHQYNKPRYSDTGVTLDLSFDAIYTCTIPWAAIDQIVFYPAAPSAEDEPSDHDDEAPQRPHLRLIT